MQKFPVLNTDSVDVEGAFWSTLSSAISSASTAESQNSQGTLLDLNRVIAAGSTLQVTKARPMTDAPFDESEIAAMEKELKPLLVIGASGAARRYIEIVLIHLGFDPDTIGRKS